MISLIVPPKDQVSRVNKMLTDEMGAATNIKSRVNRQSVLAGITSTQQRLKLYNRVPDNGLVIYCGTIEDDQGKTKKINIDFEPFKPINTSLYLCDNKFHTAPLSELLESNERFGFIVMDGSGALFGVVSGSSREVLHRFSVELPKKHGRGGQSAVRFARLRLEKRHNYLRKVAETANGLFIQDNSVPNVAGLILAGLADFKNELAQSDIFDQRLRAIIIKIIDVQYGGDNGFSQAIELSANELANVKLVQEKHLITQFFEEISKDTGKYCYGVADTMTALDMGAVKTLILWDNIELERHLCRSKETGNDVVKIFTPAQAANMENFRDAEGKELEPVESLPLSEWLANNYKRFGTELQFITDRSEEGSQFCKGFGGLGGLLRYRVDFAEIGAGADILAGEAGDDDSIQEDDFM